MRTPELARDYPLVMTNAKLPQHLHSQHRGVVRDPVGGAIPHRSTLCRITPIVA